MKNNIVFYSELSGLKPCRRGKVRDIYDLDEQHMLIVTTDRLSAFDVVLPTAVPGKGEVLTNVSNFWFGFFRDVVPNHLTNIPLHDFVQNEGERAALGERAVVVRRLKPLPVEAIVRGYLVGSGWKDYQRSGAVCGLSLPAGLQQADKLEEPLYTPSTKAEVGEHDENVDFAYTESLLGSELAARIRDLSLDIYRRARDYAAQRGIIIADTKFEFGLDENDQVVLIDEVLTPDSSRFWPADQYRPGISPPSFDKQFVRDYLETLDWDKKPPGPELPADIVEKTAAKYHEAQQRLIG